MDPVLTDINKINKRSNSYIVYSYLFKAIDYSIKKYGRGKVLDIGCGNKPYKPLFTNNATEYIGCDINQTESNSVDIICNIIDIPLPDRSIDTILCTQVIEHVFDHKKLINEMKRLLKKDGVLILSGPAYWPVHGEPNDFFRFTRFGFQQLLETNGFAITETIENGGAWATAGQSLVHSFEFSKNKSVFFRVLRFAFYKLRLIWITNTLFKWLDKKDYNPVNPINYVIIAVKTE